MFEKRPGSGIWWIRYADGAGKIRREKAGRKSAALMLVRKRKTEVLEGKKLPETLRRRTVTLGELGADVLAYSQARKRTYKEDVARLNRVFSWFGRDRAAESVTAPEIERAFESAIARHHWAPSTINHYRSLLSLMFRLGITNGKVSSNPARATRHRLENNDRTRHLSAEEEDRLRAILGTRWPEHLPELELAVHTGLRCGEMFGLEWRDVDLAGRFVHVRRGKNGEGRYVHLNSVALGALAALKARGDGSGRVIRNLRGDPLHGPRHWFIRALKLAEIGDFHWHDLRHTFASRLAMAGVGLAAIQRALGHKSPAMTMRYAHLTETFMLEAVERLVPESRRAAAPSSTDARGRTSLGARDATAPPTVH